MSAQLSVYGTIGKRQRVIANHIEFKKYKEGEIFQYDVVLKPDKGEFKKPPRPEFSRAVFEEGMRVHRNSKLKNIPLVYDGRKIAYASKRVCGKNETLNLEVKHKEDGRESILVIQLCEAAVIDASSITRFIRGESGMEFADIQPALNALDTAIGTVARKDMVGFGRSFFTGAQSIQVGGGLELWRGFSLSVRPGIDRLYLNVNTAVTAMYVSGELLQTLMDMLNVRDPFRLRDQLTPQSIRRLDSYLRGLELVLGHRGIRGNRRLVAKCLTKLPLDKETFEWEDPSKPGSAKKITIAQYYRRRYNVDLSHPYLPGILSTRGAIFPIELCTVAERQRFRGKLDERQTADMVKFACQRPHENMNRIIEVLQMLDLDASPLIKSFGISLNRRLAEVESRVLLPPVVKYDQRSRESSLTPVGGAWNMRNKRVTTPGMPLKHWAVLVLANQRHVPVNMAQNFVKVLVDMCNQTGYHIIENRPPIIHGNPNADIVREMRRACNAIKLPSNTAPQLLLVVLPSMDAHIYQTIKNCAYTTLGIQTQCMQSKHMQRPNPQYCANVCLKINAKLGGTNQCLDQLHLQKLLHKKPTLFFGCDVTHPAPGETKPSIASVVGSTDFMGLRYAATLIQLPSRQEIVDRLEDAVVRHLKLFFKGTKTKPQHIVFYRDGVSETQFSQVRDRELIAIQRACLSIEKGYKPEITFLAVLKRHNTRFFPIGRDGDRTGNCVPGTVIDTSVTMPNFFDFYLFAHAAIQGTSRPTHYYVLQNGVGFTADEMQQLTYHLCYTYAICTRSVSLVPPVYYAHRVADRARCHLVNMGIGFEEATSASSGHYGGAGVSTSAQTGDPSTVSKIIKTHDRLDGSMYFM
ncbi:Piwi-domain-containing protein [Coemansia reversa NRRL 1564]|uniref:Piwi-domain-containing protein n=1 Tax=Coemansia reversa (strain ATCC 12441 / NRRL 1564) TaxID=763665 RepID=A0A2G5B274_COERN|nr:Piwi-domain-containing protein [Coemansia reversa NRRL 1564]|eukprot:PIA13123.1 Piwi-domain-containing protein [Coemansia reversa NRRL 1564]